LDAWTATGDWESEDGLFAAMSKAICILGKDVNEGLGQTTVADSNKIRAFENILAKNPTKVDTFERQWQWQQ